MTLPLAAVDMATFSAHKIFGLKGSGILYHREHLRLLALISAGQQEGGLRGGTSNAPTEIVFAKTLRLVPVSGYMDGWRMAVFLILPVAIGIFSRLGSDTLLYRAMFLEEIGKDYVRTARAKGASEARVMFVHVLRNALLPILTSTVAVFPMLFMGSLIMESFFGIPGLGSYTIDAINAQDFSIVRAMVFLGTAAYVLGLILTDVAYTIADPRIRLK